MERASGTAAEAMMDMTPVERRHATAVRSLRRLCVEAVADNFGRHSRELLNLSPSARELLLAHLKARFNPARRHRRVGGMSGLPEGTIDWFVLPDVRSLDLSRCATLSSRTLAAVASNCFQLTALDLSHAASLTDADLRPLFPAAFPFTAASASASAAPSSLPFSGPASSASSPASSGALAFPLTASPSSSSTSSSNSYSFASSPAPAVAPASPAPQSPGFWNRLFSRSQTAAATTPATGAAAAAAAAASLSLSPPLSPATSSSNLSSLPAAILYNDEYGPTVNLRSINLRNCSGLTSASVENILRLWSCSLQSLTLDGDRINPASVAALAGASHLTRLALLHSPYLKPIPVSEMKSMDKAEESKYPVFEWQLMPALQGCLTPAMTELILHFDSETITEEIVCQIVGLCGAKLRLLEMPLPSPEAWKLVLRHCTSLRKLDLYGSYCTDEAVSGMAHFPSATEVIVRGCSLSDESFARIASACPKTTKVELRSVETVTDAGLEAIAKAVAVNLRDLTIASLEQVTDAALQRFSDCCPNLRTLQLSGMSSDNPTQKLTGGTMMFPRLKELRLSSLYCADATMAAVLAQCTQLRVLHLDDVGGVTGKGVKSSSLWHLQLRSTPHVTDQGVESMVEQCPQLRSVRVKHQATALRSLLCLLGAPRLLELRIGEGNLLEDAHFLPASLDSLPHVDAPRDDNQAPVEVVVVAQSDAASVNVGEKAEAIESMNKEDEDGRNAGVAGEEAEERQREVDQKTSEDHEWGTADEQASKGSEDMRHHRPPTLEPDTDAHVNDQDGQANDREESAAAAVIESLGQETTEAVEDEKAPTARAEEAQAKEAAATVESEKENKEEDEEDEDEEDEPMAVCPLRDVKLKNCPLVTDRGVRTLMRRCRHMARLRLYYFPQVTGRTLGGESLRSLVLDQCGLTNEGFVSLIKASPRLRDIEISGAGAAGTSHPRERRTIRAIAQLVEFTKLSDEGLRELERHCPLLRSLSLSFLNNVTLQDVSLPQLESLALEDMPAVTDESLGAFVGRSTKLCRLDVRAGALRLDKGTTRGSRDRLSVMVSVMNVTAPFVEALKTSRSNLAVTYRLMD